MPGKKPENVIRTSDLAAVRARANETRRELASHPGVDELLTAEEVADAAPFYFALRAFIKQLKDARETAGWTLADVAAKSGLPIESLSRLETGATTNPTWKTLGLYAAAVGRRPDISARPMEQPETPKPKPRGAAATPR